MSKVRVKKFILRLILYLIKKLKQRDIVFFREFDLSFSYYELNPEKLHMDNKIILSFFFMQTFNISGMVSKRDSIY